MTRGRVAALRFALAGLHLAGDVYALGALDGGAYAAAWRIYDATGIRPEYLLPVLWSESGFNPAARNAGGYPYEGINQAASSYLQRAGIDPDDYLTWPASQQMDRVVLPMMKANVGYVGAVPESATRVYQMNFLPASLRTAPALASVLAWRGSNVYTANAGLDWMHKGAITVADLAHYMAKAASSPAVQSAIAATYAQRPGERARNPVYGADFLDPLATVVAIVGTLAVGAVGRRAGAW